jgi:DNA-binding CsgD family transcriptional regulator/cell division protein FtsB
MRVDRVFLWPFDPATKTLAGAHEWLAEGHSPEKPRPPVIPLDSLPWVAARLVKGHILRVDDTRSAAAAERELMEGFGLRACLMIPLFSRDAFYGVIGLGCFKGPASWAAEDVQVLQTAAEILMRCIENRQVACEFVTGRKNLEKAVGKKTLALRKANERLAAEIAAHRKSIAALRRREAELEERNRAFLELSNGLVAMLNQSTPGPREAGGRLAAKLERMIGQPAGQGGEGLDSLQSGLKELGSLLKTRSAFVYQCLTPMETQVAKLVAQGKGNKEIASLLNLSRRTVEVHRYNIRKKLELDKSRTNLKSYLLSMG